MSMPLPLPRGVGEGSSTVRLGEGEAQEEADAVPKLAVAPAEPLEEAVPVPCTCKDGVAEEQGDRVEVMQ